MNPALGIPVIVLLLGLFIKLEWRKREARNAVSASGASLADICECGHWRLSHHRVLGCLVVLVGRRPGMCTCPGFRMKEPAPESETGAQQ